MQFVIFASERLDGVSSSAIVARSLRMRNSNYKIGKFLHHFNIEETLKEMAQLKHSLIFVLDFSPEQIPNLKTHLEKISKNNRIVYWSSHHDCSEQTKDLLKNFVKVIDFTKSTSRICAAELAHKKFLPTDSVSKELQALAHDIEFWINSDARSKKLSDLIAAGYNLTELIDLLSKGVFWSDSFESILNEYNEKRNHAFEFLMKKLSIKSYSNYRIGFSFASPVLNSADACQFMLDSHDGFDISCVIFRNGKISFRRRDDNDLNLKDIAKLFNGGGHPYASGGVLTGQFKQVNSSNQDDVLFYVDRKLKEHIIK